MLGKSTILCKIAKNRLKLSKNVHQNPLYPKLLVECNDTASFHPLSDVISEITLFSLVLFVKLLFWPLRAPISDPFLCVKNQKLYNKNDEVILTSVHFFILHAKKWGKEGGISFRYDPNFCLENYDNLICLFYDE